jgi:hypothetical protein
VISPTPKIALPNFLVSASSISILLPSVSASSLPPSLTLSHRLLETLCELGLLWSPILLDMSSASNELEGMLTMMTESLGRRLELAPVGVEAAAVRAFDLGFERKRERNDMAERVQCTMEGFRVSTCTLQRVLP